VPSPDRAIGAARAGQCCHMSVAWLSVSRLRTTCTLLGTPFPAGFVVHGAPFLWTTPFGSACCAWDGGGVTAAVLVSLQSPQSQLTLSWRRAAFRAWYTVPQRGRAWAAASARVSSICHVTSHVLIQTLPLAEGQRGPCVKPTLFPSGQGFLHGWVVRAPVSRSLWPRAFCGMARPMPRFDRSRVMHGSPLLRVVPSSPPLPRTTLRLGKGLRRCGLEDSGFSGFPAAADLPRTCVSARSLLLVTGHKL
jgi:hypothetical protein